MEQDKNEVMQCKNEIKLLTKEREMAIDFLLNLQDELYLGFISEEDCDTLFNKYKRMYFESDKKIEELNKKIETIINKNILHI